MGDVMGIYLGVLGCCMCSVFAAWMSGAACFEDDKFGPDSATGRGKVFGRYGGGCCCLCFGFPAVFVMAGEATDGPGAVAVLAIACCAYGIWVAMLGPLEDDKWGPDERKDRAICSVKFAAGSCCAILLCCGLLVGGVVIAGETGDICVDYCQSAGYSRRRLGDLAAVEGLTENGSLLENASASRRLQSGCPTACDYGGLGDNNVCDSQCDIEACDWDHWDCDSELINGEICRCSGVAAEVSASEADACGCDAANGFGWCSSQDPPTCGSGCTTSGADECSEPESEAADDDGKIRVNGAEVFVIVFAITCFLNYGTERGRAFGGPCSVNNTWPFAKPEGWRMKDDDDDDDDDDDE